MKLLLTSDWHLRTQRPMSRMDYSYVDTQTTKLRKIKRVYEMGCDAVLHSGDLFDNVDVSHFITQHYIKILKRFGMKIYVVPGQHDMRFHSHEIKNTPIAVLRSAGVITVLDKNPVRLDNRKVHVYGQWWGEPTPKILHATTLNVLVTHRMVTEQKPGYKTEYITGRKLLEKTKYDVIVSGDNHETFTVKDGSRVLVNPGSLMRSSIDQIYHKPCVFIYDTETRKAEQHFLKVALIGEVLNRSRAKREKKVTKELEEFSDELLEDKISERKGLNFRKNLDLAVRDAKNHQVGRFISKIVRDIDVEARVR